MHPFSKMKQTTVEIIDATGPRSLIYLLLAFLVAHRVYVIIYRLFFSPLTKFPGPKLAAATSWYESFWDLWDASFPDRVKEMHDKYGLTKLKLWSQGDMWADSLQVPLCALTHGKS